ncbi:hypothetical protein TVAGG3_0854330, partial [Trichomonas vaginalis G3]
ETRLNFHKLDRLVATSLTHMKRYTMSTLTLRT